MGRRGGGAGIEAAPILILKMLRPDRFIGLPEHTLTLGAMWEDKEAHNSYAHLSPLLAIQRSLCNLLKIS